MNDYKFFDPIFGLVVKYFPVFLTVLAVYNIHVIQLRHFLLKDIKPLTDITFFFDVSSELFWALLISGILARFCGVLLAGGALSGVVFLVFCLFYFGKKTLYPGDIHWYDAARAVQWKKSAWFDLNRQTVEAIMFFTFFYFDYCNFYVSWIGALVFSLVLLAWLLYAAQFVAREVDIPNIKDPEQFFAEVKLSDWKPRALLAIALTLVAAAYLLATVRAHYLISEPCIPMELEDSSRICLTIVGKTGDGIFGYSSENSKFPVFLPFDALKMIGQI